MDFWPYFGSQTVRKLEFNTPNLLGVYVKQLEEKDGEYEEKCGSAEVICALVDANRLASDCYPFD